jgi:NhaP-type Na+/H+ or K+/H+ antiporter
MSTTHLADTLVLIAVLGMGAQWLAWRLHLPAIVLLALAGLVVGPIAGWLNPTADLGPLLPVFIKLGVAIILFEGGLNLKLHELKTAATGVKRLVMFGGPLVWILGTGAAHYVGGLSWPVSLVFGAIAVVTGPTVILPLLRQARLKRRPASYLKWEGIINDPIGALLAILIFQHFVFAHTGSTLTGELWGIGAAVALAVALGVGGGWLLARIFVRGFVPEFLKPPIILAMALAVYSIANLVQEEAGLLAITIFGLVLGNMQLPSIDELRRFKEYITIILVSGVFILLTADLDPALLAHLHWRSALLLAAVLFVVRPLAVFAATLGTDMPWRERLLVGWIAPRGIVAAAVAGVFAPEMVAIGYADAALLVPLVFSLVLLTVFVHGFSLGWIARRLGLASTARNGVLIVGGSPWSTALSIMLKEMKIPVLLVDWSWHRLRAARLDGISVYFGEILSERAEESVELNEIGSLLAATDNDAYNALVCTRFAADLGRSRVFQLPMYAADEQDPRGVARTLRGSIAFGENAQYEELVRRTYQGWEFQKTRFTENYTYETYLQESPREAVPVLLVRGETAVQFVLASEPPEPKPDDVLVSFVPPRPAHPKPAQP